MKSPKSDTRPTDPYRRQPPTIDLPAGEFKAAEGGKTAAAAPEEEVATAIEPMASTGLDASKVKSAAEKSAGPTSGGHEASKLVGEKKSEEPQPPPRPAASTSVPPAGSSAPAASASTVPETRARTGFGSLVAAGLVGGVIGAGFAVGADLYWRQPPADFESRLASLESRPAVTAGGNAAAATTDRRLTAAEAQLKSLSEGVAAVRSVAETGAKQAAEALNRPAATQLTSAATPDPGLREAVDRANARLSELEGAVRGAVPASGLEDIRTQVAGLQKQVADLDNVARSAAAASALDAIRAQISGAQSQTEDRLRASAATIGSVQAKAGELDRQVAGNAEKLAALQASVEKLPPALMQTGLRAVVAGQVQEGLRSGVPLAPALAALDRLGAGGPNLEPLRPFADQAAPSTAVLASEFKPLAATITATPQGSSASIADRLLRVADKVVTVRAVGDGSGRDIPGIVGRIEASLARGALAEAASAWDTLPEDAKRASADWASRLKRRVAADEAARRLGAEALAALDAPAR